jgi:hypothetical protein
MRIGPEPTTDRFVAVMHGDEGILFDDPNLRTMNINVHYHIRHALRFVVNSLFLLYA